MDESSVVIGRVRVGSDFLVARPSFSAGIARLFDLFGRFDVYNTSPSGAAADCKAMRADWLVVGQDLYDAVDRFREEHPELAKPRV